MKDAEFSPDLARKYTVADMLTGYGVAEAVKHYYAIYGGEIVGKRAIVQGFGNVGSAAAYYLTKLGVKVVGIIDRDGGVICEEGFSLEAMTALFLSKDGNKLVSENMISFDQINEQIWRLPAENFYPSSSLKIGFQSASSKNDRYWFGSHISRCERAFCG